MIPTTRLLTSIAFLVVLAISWPWQAPGAETTSVPEQPAVDRLRAAVEHLAADDMEGRGIGTEGLNKAASYLAEQFTALGLKVDVVDGAPFQTFEVTTGSELGEPNSLAFIAPDKEGQSPAPRTLNLGADFTPLSLGGSSTFDLPVVFVGYGITAKEHGYDDYAAVDVKDKAVLILRHEPQQDNPHSAFNGTDDSPYGPLTRKVSNAYEHGAAAVLFCTDDFAVDAMRRERAERVKRAVADLRAAEEEFQRIAEPTADDITQFRGKLGELSQRLSETAAELEAEEDALLNFHYAGSSDAGRELPVLHCRRQALEPIVLEALGTSLAALEEGIDLKLQPQSMELAGWRMQGQTSVKRTRAEVKNVIAVLEGEGPLADESIVVGAHYDHLGYGGDGSFTPNVHEIHNGADDNASGTAALLEVARLLNSRATKLPRRVVLMAFTGEERGLLGSAHYAAHPLFPLDKTIAMLNMDMVGRLRDDKLIIQGVDTAPEFGPIIDNLNAEFQFQITRQSGGFGPSDHASFYGKQIPVMHFFTDLHDDYHRPSDDADKVNVEGMLRVANLVVRTAEALANAEVRPTYVEVAAPQSGGQRRGGDRPYFGSVPDFAQTQEGYAISGVAKGGPAERAGLLAGDVIIQLGDSKIGNLDDFDSALRKFKGGDKAPVVVRRNGEEKTFEVELEKPR